MQVQISQAEVNEKIIILSHKFLKQRASNLFLNHCDFSKDFYIIQQIDI